MSNPVISMLMTHSLTLTEVPRELITGLRGEVDKNIGIFFYCYVIVIIIDLCIWCISGISEQVKLHMLWNKMKLYISIHM